MKPLSYYASGDNFYRDGKTGEITKKHNLSNQLGDKILGNQYAPAWKINFLSAPNFQNYISGSIIDGKTKTFLFHESLLPVPNQNSNCLLLT